MGIACHPFYRDVETIGVPRKLEITDLKDV